MLFSNKENYGHLGKLTKKEWKTLLYKNSDNNPLFKKINKKTAIIGPKLVGEKIIGDMGATETMTFGIYATNEQKEFYKELLKTNKEAAIEYLFVITNSYDIWKKDLKIIEQFFKYLKKEELKLLEEEKNQLEKDLKKNLTQTLKKHFPERLKNINLEALNLEQTVKTIKKIIERDKKEENFLKKYLEETQKKYPFLFEDN